MFVNEKGNKGIAAAVVMGLVIVAGLVGWTLMKKDTDDSMTPAPVSVMPSTSTSTDSGSVKKSYKDGSYESIGNYISPGGNEEIDVSLTLKSNVISDITVTPKATGSTAMRMQKDFANNYKVMVIGKNIDDVTLTKVSGSSLTPKGFNDAIEKIKSQAQS